MNLRLVLTGFSFLMLFGCGGKEGAESNSSASDTAVTTAIAAVSDEDDEITCPQYFSELRHAVIGTLRGTDYVQLVSQVTPVAASTQAAVASEGASAEKVSSAICNYSGKKLRRARLQPMAVAAQASAPRTLAPSCAVWIDRVDNECFTPLIESGQALSDECTQMLWGVSAVPVDLDQRMGSEDYCASM